MRLNSPGRVATRSGDRTRYGDTIKSDITLGLTVGMKFSKPITQSLGGDEPMVFLDAAALTQRIGSISHPEKPAPPEGTVAPRGFAPPLSTMRALLDSNSGGQVDSAALQC